VRTLLGVTCGSEKCSVFIQYKDLEEVEKWQKQNQKLLSLVIIHANVKSNQQKNRKKFHHLMVVFGHGL